MGSTVRACCHRVDTLQPGAYKPATDDDRFGRRLVLLTITSVTERYVGGVFMLLMGMSDALTDVS
ncbi:MAG: hypothetical protein M3N26_03815, partial [Pseudomonadota bacterium]|nr:hypothetical protein [Pseudomonadota bacterium]